MTIYDRDFIRRVTAFHEAGHAVMAYGLGADVEYAFLNLGGGAVLHKGHLADKAMILYKAAGAIGAEFAFDTLSEEQSKHIYDGGWRDFQDSYAPINNLHDDAEKPKDDNTDRDVYRKWVGGHYSEYQNQVREIFANESYKLAIIELAESLMGEKPHFRDSNWKRRLEQDQIHAILSKYIQQGDLTKSL